MSLMRRILAVACLCVPCSSCPGAMPGPAAVSPRPTCRAVHEFGLSIPAGRALDDDTAQHRRLIGLEFHVDYWDTAEWHDPVLRTRSTQSRQQVIASAQQRPDLYAADLARRSVVWVNWPKGSPPEPADAESAGRRTRPRRRRPPCIVAHAMSPVPAARTRLPACGRLVCETRLVRIRRCGETAARP
jgi:hypothetical protein